MVEREDHIDKEEESDFKKDTEQSETSESYEINIINSQINNIDLIYEVLDVNSKLPQVGTSDTSLTNIQDAKLYRTKPEKGMGYTAEKSSRSIVMVENQEEKVNFDTGAYCTCVGKSYLKTIVPDWEEKLIPIQGVKFSSASESIKPLKIIDLALIFPHPSQCIRLKVEFLVMENCTSNHFILGNDYLSIYGIDISNQKDGYFTIGENKRQKFGFFNNKRQMTEKLIDLLFKHKNAFSTDKEPLGSIIGHEVDIILNVEKPYPPLLRGPAYPDSPRAREYLEVHIKELMDLGVLRKVGHNEQVEGATPVIIAWNNVKSRMVGDFRALNTYTIPDRYPMPRIHETLTQLSQAKFIIPMDALKGFHQNFLTENSKRLLRIIVHCGIFESLRMPFGITNASSHYERMINTIFPEEFSEGWLIIYIDGTLVCSETWDSHLTRLERVLQKIVKVNMKTSLKKCHFAYSELKALGHVVSGLNEIWKKAYDEGRFHLLDGILYNKTKHLCLINLTDRTLLNTILHEFHDSVSAGHLSEYRTLERVKTCSWWPNWKKDVSEYCQAFDRFQKATRATGKKFGMMIQIQEPKYPWEIAHMDWVTELPPGGDRSYNACLVLVDRYSKTPMFLPCHKNDTAIDTAILIWNKVISHTVYFKTSSVIEIQSSLQNYGQTSITCLEQNYHSQQLTTPKTDGLAERMIQTLGDMIGRFCAYGQQLKDSDGFTHDWCTLIPALELAYKTLIHSSTGNTPEILEKGLTQDFLMIPSKRT
ncbi:hypothetical protein O181_092428 [Austropuccinia psidii MF-1]|uniref:Integrase catalytic domain-containing protein n=1 Tax=Austropuccinia psidii MF-1 TaxID=1389203 RepID=A0A9Q3IYI7_9BASI|nr:hypothetical protein [Austropuccinia psidii MF-1]